MAISKPVSSLLRASIADDSGTAARRYLGRAEAESFDGLCEAAEFHGVASYVHEVVAGDDRVPLEVRVGLERARERTVFRHLRTLSDLSFLRQEFEAHHVPWLVVKGPALAVPAHGFADLRPYGDLDVVVPGEDLGRVIAVLEASGCEMLDRNWVLILREVKGEVHLRLPSGTYLDLHWHLLNDPARRRAFPIDMSGLFERAVPVDVGGVEVPTLAQTDLVVYVAMHTMHSGGHRLVWLKDLERLLAEEALSLEEVANRARSWRAELVLAAAALRVQAVFGRTPATVWLARLERWPPLWSGLLRLVWRLAPAEREDGGPSIARIVANSTRGTAWESIRELARRSWAHTRDPSGSTGGRRFAETDPRSGRFASGGHDIRGAYLETVARESRRLPSARIPSTREP